MALDGCALDTVNRVPDIANEYIDILCHQHEHRKSNAKAECMHTRINTSYQINFAPDQSHHPLPLIATLKPSLIPVRALLMLSSQASSP